MADSLRSQLDKRLTRLKTERDNWLPEWRDLSDHIMPRAGRFNTSDVNKGQRRDKKIINPRATFAARTLAAGMHSGMTSPASPWFKLGTPDPGLMQYGPVKEWLYAVEKAMREVMARSNLYNVLPTIYGEEGVFGTAAMAALPDERDTVRFYPFTIGSYMIANSDRQQVDTLYREFKMTARQMEQQFGKAALSSTTQTLLSTNSEAWVEVCHATEPNENREPGRKDNTNMSYQSVYWEKGGDSDKLLRQSGFQEFPVMAPRWDVNGEDVYGTGPGSQCIGSTRALQLMERRKAELVEKGVRPPMGAPASLQVQKASILPGSITYLDDMQQGAKFAPLWDVNPAWLGQLRGEIAAEEQIADTAFFVDLFLMMRQNDDLLDPCVDQVFHLMVEQSIPRWMGLLPGNPLLPPPPKEMGGLDLRIEYTSILAQAQRAVEGSAIERAIGFAGTVANIKQDPSSLDLLDTDNALREYFKVTAVPPALIRSDDAVQAIREQRAQAQQQAQMEQQLGSAIEGVKVLSQADTGSNNALTQIAGMM